MLPFCFRELNHMYMPGALAATGYENIHFAVIVRFCFKPGSHLLFDDGASNSCRFPNLFVAMKRRISIRSLGRYSLHFPVRVHVQDFHHCRDQICEYEVPEVLLVVVTVHTALRARHSNKKHPINATKVKLRPFHSLL